MDYNLIDKNIKLILSQVLTENISTKIILCSISKYNIKNLIGEKIIKYVAEHPKKEWKWEWLAKNSNITIENAEKHPEIRWDWHEISRNPNVNIEYIEKHPEKNWDWYGISLNSNVTMEYVDDHPELDWNFAQSKFDTGIYK